jgi:fermentation-respiration switch protein FrsA (DUF1100 family)
MESSTPPESNPALPERRVEFQSAGTRCVGTLYLPAASNSGAHPPIVVMGHGFAAERNFGTRGFVERFTQAGLAVLLFDYRGFGESEGEPRQIVDPALQLEDWRAALRCARDLPEVDARKLGIWGTSFGGGHVLTIAAEDAEVAAVVAQAPHCDTYAAFQTITLRHALRTMWHGVYDALRGLFGLTPHCIPVVGEPGDLAVMTHPGWKKGYLALVPEDSKWVNAIPARSLLRGGNYRPIQGAHRIACPALILYGKRDAGIPEPAVQETARRIPQAELVALDADHFEVYTGPVADEMSRREADFFARSLGLVAS